MAVDFDSELIGELVALLPRTAERHRESIFFHRCDPALELTQFAQIHDRLVAWSAQKLALEKCAADRDILKLADRFFGSVREVNLSPSPQTDTSKAPFLLHCFFDNIALVHVLPRKPSSPYSRSIMRVLNNSFNGQFEVIENEEQSVRRQIV